jgi:cytochrome c oxidase subunit 2
MAGIGLITVVLTLSPLAIASAVSHRPGTACPKVGAKALSGNTPVKCVKSAKKLMWKTVKKVTPSAKPIPQPSSTVTNALQEISVTANQWNWQFKYVKAGVTATVFDPSAQPPVLYIPIDEPVRFTLMSNDVSHGFWIPGLLIDMKVTPGSGNRLDFIAKKLGTFPGRCNVVCGRGHASMIFTVKVVTPAEYQTYLSSLNIN